MSEYTDMLDAGYVPADRVRGAMNRALGSFEWSIDEPKLQPLTRMWELDDLKKMFVERDGKPVMWVRFDLADKILCLLNLPHLWWGPLRRIYYRVVLDGNESHRDRPVPKGMKRCEREGCSEVFEQRPSGTPKKFCCATCKNQANLAKNDKLKGLPSGPDRKLLAVRCKNGHERTPENTYTYKGKRMCMECRRERKREAYARERAAA